MARHVTRVTEVRECARRRIFGRAAGNPLLLVVFPLRCSTENSSSSRRAKRDGGTVRSREQHADHGSQRPQRRHRQRIVCCPTTLWVNTALRAAHLPPTSKATLGFDPPQLSVAEACMGDFVQRSLRSRPLAGAFDRASARWNRVDLLDCAVAASIVELLCHDQPNACAIN